MTHMAIEKTKRLLEDFNRFLEDRDGNNTLVVNITTEQKRGQLEYLLAKITALLMGCNICMGFSLKKRGDKIKMRLELSEYKFVPDDNSTPSSTAANPPEDDPLTPSDQ